MDTILRPDAFTPKYIGEVKTYMNEQGQSIQEIMALPDHGVIPRGKRFQATAGIMLQTAEGNMPHQFVVHFDAVGVNDAFAKLNDEVNKAAPIEVEKIKKEMAKQRLMQGVRKQ